MRLVVKSCDLAVFYGGGGIEEGEGVLGRCLVDRCSCHSVRCLVLCLFFISYDMMVL